MKRIISMAMIFFISFALVPTSRVMAQEEKTNWAEEYKYPIDTNSEKWVELNHAERVLALQIPEDILEKLSTEELVEIVVEYPCFGDMLFYSSYQEGYEVVMQHFNGLQELYNRDDIGEALVSVYSKMNLSNLKLIEDGYEQFLNMLKIVFIETIIAQKELNEKFSDVEKLTLNAQMERNRAILLECLVSKETSVLATREIVETIYGNYLVLPIRTHGGTVTEAWSLLTEDTAYNYRTYYKTYIESNYPGAEVVGDATLTYNCHAYAWMRTSLVWLNDPSAFMTDGSYTRVGSNIAMMESGQVIYYTDSGNKHSGVVIATSGNSICSKWGPWSLVEHTITNCPYYYATLVTPYVFYESDYYN